MTNETCFLASQCNNACYINGRCGRYRCNYNGTAIAGTLCTNGTKNGTCDGNGNCNMISNTCARHRKPWHLCNDEERNLFIQGFLQLQKLNKLEYFIEAHSDITSSRQAHFTSAFFPWHRYYTYELETQIRNLGPQYSCFSLPYWDWSIDAGDESNSLIFSTGLGKDGNVSNNYCVQDGWFNVGNFSQKYLCDDITSSNPQCCLKRFLCPKCYFMPLKTSIEIASDIINNAYYGNDTIGYRRTHENFAHAYAHLFICYSSKCHMYGYYSPNDPLFWLHHSFVDYQWALWQTCHGYDLIKKTDLQLYPNAYSGYSVSSRPSSGLDNELMYPQLNNQSWAYTKTNILTPRDMHNLSQWSISYEKGDFFTDSKVEEQCKQLGSSINSQWFKDTVSRRLPNNNEGDVDEVYSNTMTVANSFWDILNTMDMDVKSKSKAWSQMTCEYSRAAAIARGTAQACNIPEYIEDCNNYKLNKNGDINITLTELLNKEGVHDNDCLQNIRINFYDYAKNMGVLLQLCNGDFDPRC